MHAKCIFMILDSIAFLIGKVPTAVARNPSLMIHSREQHTEYKVHPFVSRLAHHLLIMQIPAMPMPSMSDRTLEKVF